MNSQLTANITTVNVTAMLNELCIPDFDTVVNKL